MDLRKVKTLIELVESSGIGELEIQEGEERIRITRAPPAATQTVMVNAPMPSAAAPAVTTLPGTSAGAAASPATPPEPETHVKACGRCTRGVPDLGMGIGLSFEFAQEDTPTSAVAKAQHTTIYLQRRIEANGYRTLMD